MERAKTCWLNLALLPALLVAAGTAQAVGLGEARVDSYLNQPLDLTVRLIDVSDEQLESLTVRPADPEDYERLGIMSESLALGLDVSVDQSAEPPVIRVRSERKAGDPVVQILLDARWSNGRVLREYTLFLDPPTMDSPPPAESRQAARPTREEAPARERAPAAEPEPAAQPPARRTGTSGPGEYGPVASGDTLWRIARDWRPDPSLSMNQVMLAILERNPGAFRDNNVNQLLRGARLELPTAEEIAAIDAGQAAARVREQSERFRNREPATESVPVVSDAGTPAEESAPQVAAADAAADADVDAGAEDVEHRLELVPPEDEEMAGGSAGEEQAFSALQEDLARMEEELYAARMEADELRERLTEIEMFLAEEGQRLGLPDEELAAFQQALRESRTEGGGSEADASEAVRRLLAEAGNGDLAGEGAVAADDDAAGESSDEAMGDASEAAAETAAQSGADESPEPASERTVTQVGSSGDSLMGRLTGSWLLWLALLLVVVALVVVAWRLISGNREGDQTPEPDRAGAALDAARRQVRQDPEDLNSHLALLRLLADRKDEAAFAAAFEEMFGYVNSGQERQWRDALRLANRVIPEHSLVAGSVDAVRAQERPAETTEERAEAEASPDDGDIEDQTQDILRILEQDQSDEIVSAEDHELMSADDTPERPPMLGAEDEEASSFESPGKEDEDWLRDVGRPGQAPAGEDEDTPPKATGEDGPSLDMDFDMSDLEDPDRKPVEADSGEESGGEGEGESELEAFLRAHETPGEDAAAHGESPAAEDTASDDEYGPSLDFESSAGATTETAGTDEAEADDDEATAEESGDDIFSLGEDDVEVKLDLARAYISMDDPEAARTMLEEVLGEGSDSQQEQARKLLDDLD